MKKKISVTVTPEKVKEARRKGYAPSELLESALDGVLADYDPSYSHKLNAIRHNLNEKEESLNRVLMILTNWTAREQALVSEIVKLKNEMAQVEAESNEAIKSTRITELIREINRAIEYCDYIIPDINKAVPKQIKELTVLIPDFTIEKQVELIKSIRLNG